MGFFANSDAEKQAQDAHNTVNEAPHKAHLTHEVIAAAASYEASKAYAKHEAENGQPASHSKAKEFLAASAGAFVDHIVETKGLDFIDKERAKHQANKHFEA